MTTHVRPGELSERALGLAMLAPMTLVLLLVVGYPLVDALWLSLHRVNLAHPEQGQPFVGLGNYLYAFGHTAFWHSLCRTLYFTGVSVALELALGLLFAVLLNERFKGNLGARLALLFPWGLDDHEQRPALGLDPQPNVWCGQYRVRWSGRSCQLLKPG